MLGIYPIELCSQDASLEDFLDNLIEIDHPDGLISTVDQSKELDRRYFSEINVGEFELQPNSLWRFLFMRRFGWQQIVGNEVEDLTACYVPSSVIIKSEREITQMFDLDSRPSEGRIQYPGISSERYNLSYVLTAKGGSYAVVILAHNYPNGNQTSWYREEMYYFKKEI